MQKMWNDDAHIRAYIRAKMRNMKNMKRTKTTKKVLDDSEEVFNGGKYIFEKLLMMVITYLKKLLMMVKTYFMMVKTCLKKSL